LSAFPLIKHRARYSSSNGHRPVVVIIRNQLSKLPSISLNIYVTETESCSQVTDAPRYTVVLGVVMAELLIAVQTSTSVLYLSVDALPWI